MTFPRFLVNILKPLCRLLFPIKVYGAKKLPMRKTLMLGNHLSGWDAVMVTAQMRCDIAFAYKAELGERSKFLHWVFNCLDCVAVHRGDVDMTSAKNIIQCLNNDKIFGMFPEGTRNPQVNCLQKFRTGAAFYALKTHSPIVPFYIWNKTKLFKKNYLVVGDEFTLEEYYDKPLTKEVLLEATEKIKGKVDELRIFLNEQLDDKGVKLKDVPARVVKRTERYNDRQNTLEKSVAKMNADEGNKQ